MKTTEKNDDLIIAKKKLLLVGGVNISLDLIDLCHRNGVFLGVADYSSNTKIKNMADAAYDIDAFDVEGLSELCMKEHYNGVITQFIDRTLSTTARVAERIGAYSPFTEEQIRMSTDKEFFKKTCMKYGVPVPKLYDIDVYNECITDWNIEFPVLVKPVDNSSSRGLYVCNNADELLFGLEAAKEASHSGRVIVEAYMPYDEINVTYIAQNGDIQLAAIHDRYFNESQSGVMKVPDMYIYPSKFTNLYYETVNAKVIDMLKGIGIKNGSLFMQAVVHDGQVYFYEAGMRLNGCKTYNILEYENDYNTFEHIMYYCLTGNMGKYQHFNARFKRWYATWNVIGKPGMTCAKFPNDAALESYPWLIKIAGRSAEGEVVREGSAGTLLQLVARIHVMADTKELLFERIQKTQELFRVENEMGESIIFPGHDVDDLRKRVDYEL